VTPGILTVVLIVLVIVLIAMLVFGDSTSARATRLASFARRQGVEVTEHNADYIQTSLRQSRFWRRFGLLASFVSGIGVTMPFGASRAEDQPPARWLVLFAGWFLGLIVAEWRASGIATGGGHRRATLAPRAVRDYVTPAAAWVLGGFALIAAGSGLWMAVRATGHQEIRGPAGGVVAVAAAAALLVAATGRRILRRAQTVVDDALTAADDGLRARSLQLLAGGSVAATSWVAAAFLALVGRTYDPFAHGTSLWANIGGMGVLLAFAGSVAGVAVGTSPTVRTRRAPSRSATRSTPVT
jgi:hypothetical protein